MTAVEPDVVAEQARLVRDAAARDLELVLRDARAWVERDTPSGDLEALDGLAAELGETLAAYGLDVDLVPSPAGLHLHARLEGAGRARVALLGHHDTVYPRGTVAARPWHRGVGRILAPGIADMKGGLAVAAHAARLLADGPRPFGLLEVVSVPDEEPRTAPFATLERLRDFDAVLCLECGRPGGAVVTERKGGRWPRVRAVGVAAHAGADPEGGRNAVLALCAEALRIAAIDGARPGLTVHPTTFDAPGTKNTVPDVAVLGVDVRGSTTADLEWATAEIGRFDPHPGIALGVECVETTPPLERTAAVVRLADAARRLGTALGVTVGEVATGGVSDGCWTAGIGIPTLDGLGPVGGLDHSPAEYAEEASFAPRCGIVAGLVAAVDAGLLDEPEREERA